MVTKASIGKKASPVTPQKNQPEAQKPAGKNNLIVEVLNALTHGVGVAVGILFLVLLLLSQLHKHSRIGVVAYAIYGSCFIFLFLASTIYHAIPFPRVKRVLRIFDHVAIYLFIAGTFTPGILLLLTGRSRILFLVVIWVLAIIGTIFKVVTYGQYDRFKKITVGLYIAMGWLGLLFLRPILQQGLWQFFLYLTGGGVLYTVGTIFYRMEHWRYHHVIWHLFVLAAAIVQFLGFYFYLV